MAKYKCNVCGYVFDEEEQGIPFSQLKECPVCHQPASAFSLYEEIRQVKREERKEESLEYPREFSREDESCRYMKEIHEMAVTGKTVHAAMGTRLPMPSWDDILILGAQLDPMPLPEDAQVNTRTVIGKHAKKPLILENPVYISHMSFGALSKEAKVALAKGSALGKSAMCSGEGGILPEEMEAADKYIFEYVGNLYSVTPENLQNADAIEIKIGQGTKPGMGGHLPGEKVTEEIAKVRNKPVGQEITAPSRFPGINNRQDLKSLISQLKMASGGRPVGVKIAAGRIEKDLAFCVYAEPDFITIGGRGGATGSSAPGLCQRTYHLCFIQSQKISGQHRVGYQPDHHRRPESLLRFCESHRHGSRRCGSCLCSADGFRMPAVPDLRNRDVPCRGGHPGSGTESQIKRRSRSQKSGKLPEHLSGRTENVRPDYRPPKPPRPVNRRPLHHKQRNQRTHRYSPCLAIVI